MRDNQILVSIQDYVEWRETGERLPFKLRACSCSLTLSPRRDFSGQAQPGN
jgi:hypothetical protein